MHEDTVTEVRRKLKQTLYKRRVEWTKQGYQPLCAICGEPPRGGALQMHESLITRGDVQGNTELGYDIMTRYNCVLVHSDCHEYANTEEGKILCAKNILKWEKYKSVRRWLGCMRGMMNSTIPTEAIRLLIRTRDSLWREQQREVNDDKV